jgi:hypothetical protein
VAQEAALGAQQPFKSFSVNVDNQPKTSAPEVGSAAVAVIRALPSNAYYAPKADLATRHGLNGTVSDYECQKHAAFKVFCATRRT